MRMGRSLSLINSRSLSVGFPLKGGKASQASLKQSMITSGAMINSGGFCQGRGGGGIENCDDDDQSKCVESIKLGELGDCRDTTASVCGHDGNGGSSSLFGIKFELDFHCWGRRRTNLEYSLAMKKSTIDGN
jgi:hypothetical protein